MVTHFPPQCLCNNKNLKTRNNWFQVIFHFSRYVCSQEVLFIEKSSKKIISFDNKASHSPNGTFYLLEFFSWRIIMLNVNHGGWIKRLSFCKRSSFLSQSDLAQQMEHFQKSSVFISHFHLLTTSVVKKVDLGVWLVVCACACADVCVRARARLQCSILQYAC